MRSGDFFPQLGRGLRRLSGFVIAIPLTPSFHSYPVLFSAHGFYGTIFRDGSGQQASKIASRRRTHEAVQGGFGEVT